MFKALKSFGGKISMKKGETKDINDENIAKDLLNAGYIEEIKKDVEKIDTKVKEEVKKTEEKVKEEIKEEVKKVKTSKKKK